MYLPVSATDMPYKRLLHGGAALLSWWWCDAALMRKHGQHFPSRLLITPAGPLVQIAERLWVVGGCVHTVCSPNTWPPPALSHRIRPKWRSCREIGKAVCMQRCGDGIFSACLHLGPCERDPNVMRLFAHVRLQTVGPNPLLTFIIGLKSQCVNVPQCLANTQRQCLEFPGVFVE